MLTIFLIFFCATLLMILLYYNKDRNAICKSKKKLNGRTTIVTGGTCGIGLEIALDFARRGARVIIACPFEDEGVSAQQLITKQTGSDNVVFKFLDLASLKSVREFASYIVKNESRLDILVNNAGVSIPGDFLTDDGMNFIMQVNYYGHFLLTILLLPLLIKTGTETEQSRIVNMTSMARSHGSLSVEDYDKVGYWNIIKIYANSKLSLVLFSHELAKKIAGYNVVVNNVDPGLVATRMYEVYSVVLGKIIQHFLNAFFKNPFEGAQTAIHVALEDESGLVSGEVFKNCKLVQKKLKGDIEVAADKLWNQSIKKVKLQDQELVDSRSV